MTKEITLTMLFLLENPLHTALVFVEMATCMTHVGDTHVRFMRGRKQGCVKS